MKQEDLYIGNSHVAKRGKTVKGEYVDEWDDSFYKISNYDEMPPFFMTIVSPSDHWLFISSNGGLSAGRKNPDSALFPYYTDDKIILSNEITGSKSLFKVNINTRDFLWEPFSDRYFGIYNIKRNIYKNRAGNKILFEEINEDLGLTFKYSWTFSNRYGFVKNSSLTNNTNEKIQVEFLDGIRNILPFGVPSDLQSNKSTLVDAYKKNELDAKSGLGIFTLSAMIVDKAEASEALMATSVWSAGIKVMKRLVSTPQLNKFRSGFPISNEEECKASRAAYFINGELELKPKSEIEWFIVSEVNQSVSDLIEIKYELENGARLIKLLKEDILKGTTDLIQLVANADGIQLSKDKLISGRHFSNVLFNIMRGGVFEDQYNIDSNDLILFIKNANKEVFERSKAFLKNLNSEINHHLLLQKVTKTSDVDLIRICESYLPLSFSRRHGDPSRPWNYFSIETHDEFGNTVKNYEGNWRDIFQNWEALAISFPDYLDVRISNFLNATTIDGYNPYRITRNGIDWEVVEENDPWSFIGYWGDHQIIYLLKFLELSESHHPDYLKNQLHQELNVYANVPYRIKGYNEIVKNPSDTIDFDHKEARKIDKKVKELGSDGKLLWNSNSEIAHANLVEKILITTLTKLYNFIPEAGIWLNTQRPEWNDANNALVGNGVSMVTLYYLRRFISFNRKLFSGIEEDKIKLNEPVAILLEDVFTIFEKDKHFTSSRLSDMDRKRIMDELGRAGEKYRLSVYSGLNGVKKAVTFDLIQSLFDVSITFLDHSINLNKREDGLYHSYNLIDVETGKIDHLYEMLEGQVAVLSSKNLNPGEASELLDALNNSAIYREDQYSYMLYPDRELPLFFEKNNIPVKFSKNSELLQKLNKIGDSSLVEKDILGTFHFNASFHNEDDVKKALDNLLNGAYSKLVEREYSSILALFEEIFDHKSFTGRSGTFYAYEGLGSIYWHMVSKLLMAVQENIFLAESQGSSKEVIGNLIDHYYEIRAGIGLNKSPDLYGAFPTDAYSHTPKNAGAQQPGMTGQVKEDIINRWAELGVEVWDGKIHFEPIFLKNEEFLKKEEHFNYYDVSNQRQTLIISPESLAFTYCQVPIIYKVAKEKQIKISYQDGSAELIKGNTLSKEISEAIFSRNGIVKSISFELILFD